MKVFHIPEQWSYLPEYLKMLWRTQPGKVVLLVLLMMISGFLPVVSLDTLRRIIDIVNQNISAGNREYDSVLLWLGVLIASNLMIRVLNIVYSYMLQSMTETLKMNMHEKLLDKASKVPLTGFENAALYNKLQQASKVADLQSSEIALYLPGILVSFITIVNLLLYVGSVSPIFPILLILGTIPIMIVDAKYGRQRWKSDKKQSENEREQKYLEDLLTERKSAPEIRLFGLKNLLINQWSKRYGDQSDEQKQLVKKAFFHSIVGQVYIPLTMFLIVCTIFIWVLQGKQSIGFFAAFTQTVFMFTTALWNLFSSTTRLGTDLLYIQNYMEYLHDPIVEEMDAKHPDNKRDPRAVIQFHNVSFAYPYTQKRVLENINLSLYPNECVALVGQNGSGKSTLVKLLIGLYKPSEGFITMNGRNLDDIPEEERKQAISVVFQNFVRYELTGRENIGFGDLRYLNNMERIEHASKMGGAHEFIEQLQNKYETILGKATGDEGKDLSTGQWQKLAISRGYIRDAQLVVLDEPTASLDVHAEAEVYRNFQKLAAGKTSLLISHRLGSARIADRIIVLQNGWIVEEGNHAELMAAKQQYAEMFEVQAEWYKKDNLAVLKS